MGKFFQILGKLRFRWARFKGYLQGNVKIRYDPLPDEEEGFSEILWAKSIGDGLYRLENIPVCPGALNLHDVVRCKETPSDLPTIAGVVRRSGNRTRRVIFRDEVLDSECINVLKELRLKGVSWEKVARKQFVFNIDPNCDYTVIRDFLELREQAGVLWLYENQSESEARTNK